MNPKEVFDRLEDIAAMDDFATRSAELVDEWSRLDDCFDAVEPILRFMERHSSLDFGMPGPLVHFVERYYGYGYEQKLLDSIRRKPISHTVWMLNRVINGAKEPDIRNHLIGILKGVRNNPTIDENARNLANQFLSKLGVIKIKWIHEAWPSQINNVFECLQELGDIEIQRRHWNSTGQDGEEVSSFIEAIECLFTDTGLGSALEKGRSGLDEQTVKTFDELLRVLMKINDDRLPNEIINDPAMEAVRRLAREATALLRIQVKPTISRE